MFWGLELLPVAIPIYLICLFTRRYTEQKRFWINLLFIAFLIPFVNLIYLILMTNLSKDSLSFLPPCFCGAVWMFVILPITFLVYLVGYKLKHRKFMLSVTSLTFLFGGLMILGYLFVSSKIEEKAQQRGFKEYQPTIEYIENYKHKNGKYPQNINNIKIKSEKFPYYKYETADNAQNYALTVSEWEYFSTFYKYCSTKNISDCDENKEERPFTHWKIDEWVGTSFDD